MTGIVSSFKIRDKECIKHYLYIVRVDGDMHSYRLHEQSGMPVLDDHNERKFLIRQCPRKT